MLFEKFINIIDMFHQKRIVNYLKKLNLKYFIDVGAHKGEFLSYILTLNYKKIYCFEPQKKIFKILHKNYSNKKNIKLFNLGLAHKNSKIIFYENKLTATSTFSKSKNTLFSNIKNFILNSKDSYVDKYIINTRTLDEIFFNKKIYNIFLKIDVEGFEMNVIEGSQMKLKEIPFILLENQFGNHYKNNNFKDIINILSKQNFEIYKKFVFPTLHYQDVLFKKI